MNTKWTPARFERGDHVIAKFKPKWGAGEVLDTLDLGTIDFGSGDEAENIRYQTKTEGQRLSIRFADGRTRTLLTPVEILEKIRK